MTTERRAITAPLTADNAGTLTGYAVRFGRVDHGSFVEHYAPTCSAKTARESRATLRTRGSDAGVVLLAQDNEGLRFTVPVDLDTAALVRHGALEVVATFRVIRDTWHNNERTIRELALTGLELTAEPIAVERPQEMKKKRVAGTDACNS